MTKIALIFDLDGVIVDSNPVHIEAWRLYLQRHGIGGVDELPAQMFGRRNDELVQDLFGSHLSEAEIVGHGAAKEMLYRELMKSQLQNRLVPGVQEFLRKHKGAPTAVASNAEPANVDFVLDGTCLRSYFKVIVDGHQVSRPKPAPDVFLRAAGLLQVDPGNCVVFEDSVSGAQAARAAGTRVVGIATTHAEIPGTDLMIENFCSTTLERWLGSQRPQG